jgi:hypothetical protein
MAESSIRYRSWYKEFEIGEFAIFWLILETVLDHDRMISDESCLDARLQKLIYDEELGEEWYHGVVLDDVIIEDDLRFGELLGDCITHIMAIRTERFWDTLKRPQKAYEIGHFRYGDRANLDALVGLIVLFSIPGFSPPAGHPLLRKLGWYHGLFEKKRDPF